MPPPAVTIDDAIAFAPSYIALIAYDPAPPSLDTQMGLWNAGMFSEATGIFPPSQDPTRTPGQRVVTNWLAQSVLAKSSIEGPLPGNAGAFGTSAVIDAVTRTLWAVKFGVLDGSITILQQAAVVALFNLIWS